MIDTLRHGTPVQLWQALVHEAGQRAGHPLDDTRESYLVFVLLRFQRDAQLLAHTHGVDWLDALELAGTARGDALRDVGDRCLLVAGLFPDVAERRRVNVGYYIDIGRAAYQGVADAGRRATAALYEQLAASYRELAHTLAAMRRLDAPMLLRRR